VGAGLADEGDAHRRVIDEGVAVHRRQQPHGDRDDHRDGEGGEAELEGGGQALGDDGHRGSLEADGLAEVAAEQVAEEDEVLHGQRPVQPELGAQPGDLALGRVRRQKQRRRIAGETHDDEHHGGDQP
jgi:hypothetical protein